MLGEPAITIVIPTHNRNDLLSRTLDSLSKIDLPINYRQTIVIENGGEFGAKQVVSQASSHLRVDYQYYENGNKSAALNHVLSLVDDDLLVFFDDDIRVAKGLLQSYASMAADWPHCFFGGPMECDYEEDPESWVRLPPSALGWSPREDSSGQSLVFLGCNWAAFTEHLRLSGGFDPRVGPGGTTGARGQETLMQNKLREHGYSPRYIPDAMVWHYVPSNRCSERWALERAYQNGLTKGLEDQDDFPTLFRAPQWMLRKLGTLFFSAVFYSVARNKSAAHKSWYGFHYRRGVIAGVRKTLTEDR